LNYFKTLGVPVVQGRDFTSQDDVDSPPVALVSEEFVRQFFPGENPIGKRIKPSATASADKPRMREIVGVVHDMHLISLSAKPKPQIYIPHSQFATHNASLVVRSRLSLEPLIETLRRTVAELDKDVPLFRPQELSDYASRSISEPRFNALLVGLFALIALLLAAAGIFGLTSYTVTRRTQEIGIRMALGAQRGDVLRLILVHGMRLLLIGVGLGVAAVIGAGHLLQSLLFGIGAHDLTTLVGVTLILSLVTLIACWIPARRATRVNPVIALRSE
jgi:putative ABC transport system permease protein